MSSVKRTRSMSVAMGGVPKKTKKQTGVTAAQVRRTVLGLAEMKNFTANLLVPTSAGVAISPAFSTRYWCNPCYWIPLGTNNSSRVGDQIYIDSIDVAATIRCIPQTVDAPQVRYAIYVLESDQEFQDGTTGPTLNALGLASFIRVGTNTTCVIDDNVYKLKHEQRGALVPPNFPKGIVVGSQQNTFTETKFHVPIKRKFQYKSSSSGYEKFKNLYICIVAESANGGFATDVLSMALSYVVNFKDI